MKGEKVGGSAVGPRLGVLAVSAGVAIYLAFLMESREHMVLVQGKWGYWASAFTFGYALLAALSMQRSWKPDLGALAARARPHLTALFLIPVLVIGTAMLAPAKVRVLGDEADLLGVSLAMYETHENIQWTQGVYFHGQGYRPATFQYDKRAPGYPFLLAMSYELSGYRYQNAFLINAIAGGLVLWMTHMLALRWWGRRCALLSIAALASFPVFWYSVASAGFETVNLLLLLFGLWAAERLDHSRSWVDVLPLIAASSLAGLFRYESVLFAGAFFLFALYRAPRHRLSEMPWLLSLAPLAYVATGWQVFVPFTTEVPAGIAAFSLTNLLHNSLHALRFLGNLGGTESGSPLVFFAALAALPLLLRPGRSGSAPGRAFKLLLGGSYLAWAVVVLCYWHGNFENTITMRLCLPALPLIALAAALGLDRVAGRLNWPLLPALFGLAMLAATLPALVRVRDHAENESSMVFNAVAGVLERHYKGRNVLLVTSATAWFSALQVGSLNYGTFASNTEQFLTLRRAGKLDEIIVIELYDGPARQPRPLNTLRQPLPTATLLKHQLGANTVLRLARVGLESG